MKTVIFLKSRQPLIDRSWDVSSAARALTTIGMKVEQVQADCEDDLDALASFLHGTIVWPASYTVGPDPNGRFLVDALKERRIAHIGWPSSTLELNSKILMKKHLRNAGFLTPAYVLAEGAPAILPFPFPVIVKAEYSASSLGVEMALDRRQVATVVDYNSHRWGQRSLIEEWRKRREYTVAVICSDDHRIVAPIEVVHKSGGIIDAYAKSSYANIQLVRPPEGKRQEIADRVGELANKIVLGSYVRIDILEDAHGDLYFIDFNFLPGLDDNTQGRQSFFPTAIEKNYGFRYPDVIQAIVKTAM